MPAISRTMYTEESAEVEVIMANMEKLKALTKKIGGSLDRLETSGKTVGTSIRPIYGNTGRLQSANTNIEGVRQALGRIRADLDKRRKEEPVIKNGVRNSSLAEYTGAITRTRNTLEELRRSGMKSNQSAISELESLLEYGESQLDDLFLETVRKDVKPVEPLFYITKGVAFPAIPPENANILRSINSSMMSSLSTRIPQSENLYADARGSYVVSTLHNLASASVSTARKTDPNALYRQGQSGIGSYCKALENIFYAEHDNVTAIFDASQHNHIHTRVVEPSLAEFSSSLADLNKHIQNHMMTDCFLGYEIIDLVSRLATRVDSKNPSLKPAINEALRPIRATAKTSISAQRTSIESRISGLVTLPPDGSPVQPTHDLMARAVSMTEYLTPLGSILATTNPSGGEPSTLDVGADSETLFANYLGALIETLLTSLDNKSKTLLKTKAAQGIFIANNIAIIDRSLQGQEFILLPLEVPRSKIALFRKKGAKAYIDTWADLARNLQDQFYTGSSTSKTSSGRPPSGNPNDRAAILKGMSSKEKDGIKERFKSFNQGLEDLVAKHKGFKLEPEVRTEVVKEVSDFLLPLYERFFERYKEIDKGKGKVVRYDRGQLSVLLASL